STGTDASMRPRRYGSRGSTIATNDDYGKRFRNFIDAITMFSPLQPAAKSLLYEEDYPVAPFATPRDRLANLLEEPEFQQSLTEAGMAGQGLPTAAIGSVSKKLPKLGGKFSEVPIFNPSEHVGKTIAPIEADLTAGSRYFTGIGSSKIDVPEPLLGGPEYVVQEGRVAQTVDPQKRARIAEAQTRDLPVPTFMQEMGQPRKPAEAIWAARKNDLVGGQGKQADYITVHAMNPESHQSNQSVMNATLKQLAAYVRDNRLTAEQVKDLDDLIQKKVPEFPGLQDPDVFKITDQLSFDKRAEILKTLQSAKATDAGSPAAKIVRETLSNEFAGAQRHQPMLVMKPYRDADGNLIPLEMGKDVLGEHPSYTKTFAGEVVGRFAAPVKSETLYPEFYGSRRAAGMPERDINYVFGSRDYPLQMITPEIASSIRSQPFEFIQSPRQARLATDAGLGNWRVMSGKQTKGAADFNRELMLSPASSTLSQYDMKDLNKMIRSGRMSLYSLGENGKIGFGLKRETNYNNEYGLKNPLFTNDDVAIVSVFNNEKGARGVAGPGTMLEALRQGGNVLDAFSVPTAKNPNGFLPDTYERFGFEVVERIPFNKEFYTKQEVDDLVDYWKSTGWDESQGMPEIVVMKYTGDPDVRQNPVRTFFEQGRIGSAGRIANIDRSASSSLARRARRATESIPTRADNRFDDPGPVGRSDTPASRGRFSGLLNEIASLNPTDAFNLDIPTSDISSLRSLLFDP
ncbi:MAG: hypothetical protein VW270_21605, partial [Candidatus Poseidoniales archaeon]